MIENDKISVISLTVIKLKDHYWVCVINVEVYSQNKSKKLKALINSDV
jgi:hypothetical protein